MTVVAVPYTPDLTILRDYEARGLISIGSHPTKPLLFALHDAKPDLFKDILWKELRPTYARPFKVAEAE
jgi:hypothetical protein